MGLPAFPRTPANLLISASTSGTRTETVTAGETALIIAGLTSGGSSPEVSGAGATWTKILEHDDGTRRFVVFRGTGLSTGSQTVELSFGNTTTGRWSWVPATGISTSTPDSANDYLATASSARTSTDCSSAGITTAANVLGVLVQVHSASPSAIVVPTGWSRITTANSAIVLGYRASSAAFSSQKGTVSYNSITTAAIGGIAAFNGDDQVAGGQPYAKRWGGVPHWGGRSQRRG
jgi:hypothetical protein